MKRSGKTAWIFTLIALLLSPLLSSAQDIEQMDYDLTLGIIKGGKASFYARDSSLEGKKVIHYKMWGRTVGVVDVLYNVNEIYESWVDPATHLPLKAIRNVKERKYRDYSEALFHHEQGTVLDSEKGSITIPKNTNDIISIFFYLRKEWDFNTLRVGEDYEVPLWLTGKLYYLTIKYIGIRSLKTSFGTYTCYVISPQFRKGRIFKKTNAVTLWISKDENKVPLLLDFDTKVGSLKCQLTEYRKYGKVILKK